MADDLGVTDSVRRKVGLDLARPGRRGRQKVAAEMLGVSSRTVRRWRRRAAQGWVKQRRGRPPRTPEVRRQAQELVKEAWTRQGCSAGWRPVEKALNGTVPTRLVQESLSVLKKDQRRRARAIRRTLRRTIAVSERNVAWSMDSTELARAEHGIFAGEVLRDVGTQKTIAASVGPPSTWRDVLQLLNRAVLEQGGPPLVIFTDGGPVYRSCAFQTWCRVHRVLWIRSVPHTPQHNPWVERAIREIKDELEPLSELPSTLPEWRRCLRWIIRRLNTYRLRRSLGFRTADDLDSECPPQDPEGLRARLYEDACAAVENALANVSRPRDRHRAVREALLTILERFGVIQRTIGDGRPSSPEADIIS